MIISEAKLQKSGRFRERQPGQNGAEALTDVKAS
jgi:hypothetical protein